MTKYALIEPIARESYSATIGDYWDVPDSHVFKGYNDTNLWLAEMTYDLGGNYHIKRIIKRRVTMADLRRLRDK